MNWRVYSSSKIESPVLIANVTLEVECSQAMEDNTTSDEGLRSTWIAENRDEIFAVQ